MAFEDRTKDLSEVSQPILADSAWYVTPGKEKDIMKLTRINFTPSAELAFEREEVMLLMRLSATHYDAHCREVGKVGGFLFGLNNRYVLEVPEVVAAVGNTCRLSFREVDTLCKILEAAIYSRPISSFKDDKNKLELAEELKHQLHECLARLNAVAGVYQEVR